MIAGIIHCLPRLTLFSYFCFILAAAPTFAQPQDSNSNNSNSRSPRIYPQRHQDEAAVIEWGHSAIISALDAVVADFGPQTSHAALLEVETTPVFASPPNGVQLQNADEMFGNVAIVLDTDMTGYELAEMFQKHGAAAVIVVHVNQEHLDDAPRLRAPPPGVSTTTTTTTIDIPVVSISWTAATVLTTALLPDDERHARGYGADHKLSAEGLPERIRLYAGEDRPFFEDIEAANPTVYLIHNLLTAVEADDLLRSMSPLVTPIIHDDCLNYSDDISYLRRSMTERAVQWQGLLPFGASFFSSHQKAVSERIDQVTGFPAMHVSDFIVDKVSSGRWDRHYDSLLRTFVPLASITVFLNDHDSAVWKFPLTKGNSNNGNTAAAAAAPSDTSGAGEIHIRPRKGMAIVHHNTDVDTQRFDPYAVHELDMNGSRIPLYIARKIILPVPLGMGRRVLLPLVAWWHGGILPRCVSQWHEMLMARFGPEDGPRYFDWALVIVPSVILLLIVSVVIYLVTRRRKPPVPLNGGGGGSSSSSRGGKKSKKKD